MKGSHALTASFSTRVANRGQCKLNKCLSLGLSLTALVSALERYCWNWRKHKHRLLLAPFLCWMFCPRPRETMGEPVCRLWPVLCFSASLCPLPSCNAKGFSLKRAFCLKCPKKMQTPEQSCDLTGTSGQSKPLPPWRSFFFPASFSSFRSLSQAQERELLSTYGHTCCLYRTLQFRHIKKSRMISVFLAEDILKNSAKPDLKPVSAFSKLTTTSNYVGCFPSLMNRLQGSPTGEIGWP